MKCLPDKFTFFVMGELNVDRYLNMVGIHELPTIITWIGGALSQI
jgi:hypothetical protein